DISVDGCYVESPITLPMGTSIELKLLESEIPLISGKVVTHHPQVGNGIQFVKVSFADRDALARYIKVHLSRQSAIPSNCTPRSSAGK
ncbi:MAG: PilZ domain-containing protein, partial [Terriglobales bacterium]